MNLIFMTVALGKIEIQQQPNNINLFTCELHQILANVLVFNPAFKVINITLANENEENDTGIGVAEKKDGLKLLMTSPAKFPSLAKWYVQTGSYTKHAP